MSVLDRGAKAAAWLNSGTAGAGGLVLSFRTNDPASPLPQRWRRLQRVSWRLATRGELYIEIGLVVAPVFLLTGAGTLLTDVDLSAPGPGAATP